MLRFEQCNVKTCTRELIALGNNNMKMWNLFQWLDVHDNLQNGTQADILKLYCDNELVAYGLIENYEARSDKGVFHQGTTYRDLGVVHFVTLDQHRNKGYATLLANTLYSEMIKPLLARYTDCHGFVTATGRAAPLMERTELPARQLVKQFYSDQSFQVKVIDYLKGQK